MKFYSWFDKTNNVWHVAFRPGEFAFYTSCGYLLGDECVKAIKLRRASTCFGCLVKAFEC